MTYIGTVGHGVSEWPLFWSRFAPERPAIVYGDRTITWRAFEDRVARLAGGLRRAGIAKGDRVGFLALNAPEFFETLMACARIGAIFVPFNIRLAAAEMAYMATNAELSLLIADAHFADHLGAMADQVGPSETYFVDGPPEGGQPLDRLHGDPIGAPDDVTLDDALLLAYTSGTTGHAKAAVITHANAAATSIGVINADGLDPSDRVALPAPLAFAGSMLSIGLPFMHAGGSVLIERSFDPERMLDQIEHNGITRLKLVPAIYQMMAATTGFGDRDLSGVRSATSGGAPVPVDLLETYHEHGLLIGGAYGLTEGCGFNLHLPPHEARARIGWTGLPLPFQTCRVAEDDRDVAPGEVGELLIRGQCVMREYWRAPEPTAATLRNGWLHTGDLAIRDEDGYIKIVDRLKDMIISGGINVYPAEVERVLREHPDVVDAAVIGVPDEKWGETPVACLVSRRDDLTLDDLAPLLTQQLADYKRPRRMRLLADLPRNANGKVLKRDLRTHILATLER
jgi:fatty-acyl-CoA synthase